MNRGIAQSKFHLTYAKNLWQRIGLSSHTLTGSNNTTKFRTTADTLDILYIYTELRIATNEMGTV